MARYYDHPGSVREAKNYRCYHCRAVFSTPQGVNGHLRNRHQIKAEWIRHATDWGVTDKIACNNIPSPVATR